MKTPKGNTVVDRVWVTHFDTPAYGPHVQSVSLTPWDEDYDAPITKTSENVEFVRADKQSSTEQLLEAYELLVTKTAMMLINHGDPCLLVDWDQIRQPVHASKK